MPVKASGTPVEVPGVPIDIAANAPGIEGSGSPPTVAGRPLTKKPIGLAAIATSKFFWVYLLFGSCWVGLVPMIMLVEYYRDDYSKAYCEETDLATWVFVVAWVGVGGIAYHFLIVVWFWKMNRKHYTTGGEAAVKETNSRKKWLDRFLILIVLFHTGCFCCGQSARTRVELARPRTHDAHTHTWSAGRLTLRSHNATGMIWATNSCEDGIYANITSGVWPGCATASDGHLTCNLEPRPGCCYEPMLKSAQSYSSAIFLLCAIGCALLCVIFGLFLSPC